MKGKVIRTVLLLVSPKGSYFNAVITATGVYIPQMRSKEDLVLLVSLMWRS